MKTPLPGFGYLEFPGVVEMQGMSICRGALGFSLPVFSGNGPAPNCAAVPLAA